MKKLLILAAFAPFLAYADTCSMFHEPVIKEHPYVFRIGAGNVAAGSNNCEKAVAELKDREDQGQCKVDWTLVSRNLPIAEKSCHVSVQNIILDRKKAAGDAKDVRSSGNSKKGAASLNYSTYTDAEKQDREAISKAYPMDAGGDAQ